MQLLSRSVVIKTEMSEKAKLFAPTIFAPHSQALCHDLKKTKNEVLNTSRQNEFPVQDSWVFFQRQGRELGHLVRARSKTAAPPHQEELVDVARTYGPDASWTPSWAGVLICPTGWTPQGKLGRLHFWPENALGFPQRIWRNSLVRF